MTNQRGGHGVGHGRARGAGPAQDDEELPANAEQTGEESDHDPSADGSGGSASTNSIEPAEQERM